MTPYYQDDAAGITIFHADCRDALSTANIGPVDLVLTDPPYGVNFAYASYDDKLASWRDLMLFLTDWTRSHAPMGIWPSCQINQLGWIYANVPPDWLLCWYKGSPGHAAYVGFNDWEPLLVYGKTPGLSMHDYMAVSPAPANNGHPCPKPIMWAKTLISKTTKADQVVIDPFMGSGTTLRAAKDLGRRAIGIEIDERYCEIAARRLQQEVFAL